MSGSKGFTDAKTDANSSIVKRHPQLAMDRQSDAFKHIWITLENAGRATDNILKVISSP
jgi:hypothetical protein